MQPHLTLSYSRKNLGNKEEDRGLRGPVVINPLPGWVLASCVLAGSRQQGGGQRQR
jgi:hypothetical protein